MDLADGGEVPAGVRRRRGPIVALVLLVLVLLLFALLWSQRRPIAIHYIDRELARRGVQAHYEIRQLGFGRQRLDNLRIGDPAHPDLVARWIEIELSWGFRAPRLRKVTARGVRLVGRLADGKLSLGQIDRLLPPPSGKPFSLPDLDVDLDETAMRLDTPAGRIGLAVRGEGNLSDGFRGRLAGLARGLTFGDCTLEAPAAAVEIAVSDRRPSVNGPLSTRRLACGDAVELQDAVFTADAVLSQALDGWLGRARFTSASARSGDNWLGGIGGSLSFAGGAARTKGRVDLAAANGRFGDSASGRVAFGGGYDLFPGRGAFALAGKAEAADVLLAADMIGPALEAIDSTQATPLAPAAEVIGTATANAAHHFSARASLRLASGRRGTAVRLADLDMASRSGAHLTLDEGEGLALDMATRSFRIDGHLRLGGGGFPATEAVLIQPRAGALLRGSARIAPIQGKNGRLVLGDMRFAQAADRSVRIDTFATIDGPLSDARLTGLAMPVRARVGPDGFALGEACTPARFQRLDYAALHLGPTQLSLCPTGKALLWSGAKGVQGGADVDRLQLAGRLGASAFALASDRLRFSLDGPNFSGRNVRARLGSANAVNRLDFASLTGRFTPRGVDGRFAGGSGKIANVPLLLSAANGRWQIVGGKAIVDGAMNVADEADPPRFYPLRTNDFHLTLAGNRIDAEAALIDPDTGTRVLDADIVHALDTGRGKAALDVPGIVFDANYQPEQLTRLTVGVVALVKGTLKGQGEIAWGPDGVASRGSFGVEKMDLATTFGPVTGLTTTIHFDDLLGLTTAPGQFAEVDRIQAGIDVYDGRIRYRLLPGLRVRVEQGSWPFAGGALVLEDTLLDFSRPSEKRLTFRITGMDGATFVQQMQFSNIDASGTFDGLVPMVFDQNGGRIVNGHLQARPPGGVVSYVGELSDRQLGSYGKLAFDALKSLRYSKLSIDLDGSLDGEFIAQVELDGVARNRPAPNGIAGYVLNQLAKIPFEFNITARAPFRALLATMRSMKDPSGLIQTVLPEAMRDQPTTISVQPQESETMR
ncbi:MAG TPA: YdbH domain-containing protein [Allosphingosinicella sp.]|nr:YdbH domain-containing protein [Allosphingosinicella sp.]